MNSRKLVFIGISLVTGVALALPRARAQDEAPLVTPAVRAAMDQVRADGIREHVRFLSQDTLEGRDTASAGERTASEYLSKQMTEFGVRPGAAGGSFLQTIPFERVRQDAAASSLTLSDQACDVSLNYGADFLLNGAPSTEAEVKAPLVFAGYGITAPEFNYDDYKGLDIKGALVVLLAGEPVSKDAAFFEGEKDTKYAQGGDKIARAASKGAVGCVTIVAGERAAKFPWDALRASQTASRIVLPEPARRSFPTLIAREDTAKKLFAGEASEWEAVSQSADAGPVAPFPLKRTAKLSLKMVRTPAPGPNVIGKVEGSDPALKEQAVVYTAHYDHVGKREGEGDVTFNGAWDNASGTAGVLEVARGFGALKTQPRRTVLFVFVTGEEKGLLGSRYYTRNPVVPLERTAANINLDMTDIFGKAKDFCPLGADQSGLQQGAEVVAKELGFSLAPDPTPELNTFVRSDQFSFVAAGVPALFMRWGTNYEDKTTDEVKALAKQKLATIYHKVSDEFDPTWSWEGMQRHAQISFLLGLHVAQQDKMPEWKADSRFKKERGKLN